MGDCGLGHYTSPKNEEKYCKYSYSTWCSTCERNSPRRRSRSETNEPCRRRCKEMKTLTPKKYNRCQEYENMEFEYETKGQWQEKDMRYECCRIRSNLCELPTSYISNNCQTVLTGLPKMSNDTTSFVDCLKTVASFEHTLKFVDFNHQLENFGAMKEKSKHDSVAKHVKNGKKPEPKSPVKNGLVVSKTVKNIHGLMSYSPNETYKDTNLNGEVTKSDCREHCTLVDFKTHDLSNDKPVCFDTDTYFDRRNEGINLREKYSKEVEYLREKLRAIKDKPLHELTKEKPGTRPSSRLSASRPNSRLIPSRPESRLTASRPDSRLTASRPDSRLTASRPDSRLAASRPVSKGSPGTGDEIKRPVPSTPVEITARVRKERKTITPPLTKNKSRVTLKTRVKSTAKLKRVKSKPSPIVVQTSLDCGESDCSGSDSEIEDDFDKEPDSLSEQLSDDSKRDLIRTPSIILNNSQVLGSGDAINWPIRPSLFPHIPPYIHFSSHNAKIERYIPEGKRFFKWKLSTITPLIVRKTLTNSGFALVRKSNQWLGTWGKHMKSPMFKTLKETQKLNHFPGTFQLGRKDRLWRNFQKMFVKYGHKEFGFLPHTYILPQEMRLLKQNWQYETGSNSELWIIKPPASARGAGIKVINKWSHLPKKTSLVVQKYISNPYLINGSKFDLRLYVLITSFNPLRIYLYPDGLARFASVKYSSDIKDLPDRFMHLTNYSINKMSSMYTANEDANKCQGHKWTISKLMEYLHKIGVDTKQLWRSLQQLVVKTMIACEPPITQLCDENMNNYYNCYELFGVDVLLDEKLKPWLLEVNISPSLHSASPLDAHVKGPLVQTLFDLAQFHLPPRLAQAVAVPPKCYDPRIYTTAHTKKEREKHTTFTQLETRDDYLYDILRELTGDDVRHLTRAEDELVAKGKFERVFPTSHTHKYLKFMEPRYYNRLFDAWETKYSGRREDGIQLLQTLCTQKVHLKVATPSPIDKDLLSTTPLDTSLQPSTEGQSRPLEEILREASITNSTVSAAN